MPLNNYIAKLNTHFQSGLASEHSYRADLQHLLDTLLPNILAVNEPKRTKVGAPDFILTDKKSKIPVAYIETKDIGKNLNSKDYNEQFSRYKANFDLLLITDYLDFHLYKRGVLTQSIKIAKVEGNKIVPFSDMFTSFDACLQSLQTLLTKDLVTKEGVIITIKSAEDLAKRMATKAKTLAQILFNALELHDEDFEIADGSLYKQYLSFKNILISDISHREFADIYAQTIAYGMFAARLHDTTLEDFSRQEAATLIPKSNPFLRKLFQYVASHDLDIRIDWMVDELAEVFRYTDVKAILEDFGKKTGQNDAMVHFYETFLAEYDPALRKARGVWYTPEPVVGFIVRAVDEVLKTEFALKDGLADTSKTTIEVKTDNFDKRKQDYTTTKVEVHRVQVLDPATGTGTFLAETVKHIHKKFKNQAGIWNNYVEQHLIPRLHGFELLMASYSMAHIKLDMLLRETGFTMERKSRFKIFLTNALEEHHKDAGTLFWAQWLADEAKQADSVKRDAPVMVVMGNPPYAVSSSNKSAWIEEKMKDYKKDLNERNIQPLSDDYIKFIRFGQHFIDKNSEGILAYISNNSFIDGLIHRQMRKHLLESFDKIYILDLHGNAKKKETAPDGSADQNVFDIMQGVSINIFIKTGKKKKGELGKVFHFDLQGKREFKYDFLKENNLKNIDFKELTFDDNNLFFVKKNFDERESYEKGFKIDELFKENACGIVTARDSLLVKQNKKELEKVIQDFQTLDEINFRRTYNENVDSRDWTYNGAKKDLSNAIISMVDYRPFDKRYIVYSTKSKGILSYPRNEIMKHMLKSNNLALLICKQQSTFDFQHIFVTQFLSDKCSISSQTKEASYHFPLYLYSENKDLFAENKRTPNLNMAIVEEFVRGLGANFKAENVDDYNDDLDEIMKIVKPIDILDYIYAVLHTPSYREKYKEFLKIDFPRVPFPTDLLNFRTLVDIGRELRIFHLLDHPFINDFITGFPVGGDNILGKPRYENGKVWLNVTQYFEGVSETVWNFYIGGYQPAQKWLKDRVGRKLSYEDVLHYQKIIVALHYTDLIMKELESL